MGWGISIGGIGIGSSGIDTDGDKYGGGNSLQLGGSDNLFDIGDLGDINTYTDPIQDGLTHIDDEFLGGTLFGQGLQYTDDKVLSPRFNTDPSVLQFMTGPEQRVLSARDFLNQDQVDYLTSPNDPNTKASMGRWDYYDSTGQGADEFNARLAEFDKTFKPVEYNDWSSPQSYQSQFGNILDISQDTTNPYAYNVRTDRGEYSYVPRGFTTGFAADPLAKQVQTGTDENGNPIYSEQDPYGQVGLYLSGVDWNKGDQVVFDPSKFTGGLNAMRVGDTEYNPLGELNLNEGFLFGKDELSGANLATSQYENPFRYMSGADTGLAGDLSAPLMAVGSLMTLGGPATFLPGAIMTTAGAALGSAQDQKVADDLRAAGYDVSADDLRKGHALRAAQTGLTWAAPTISEYFTGTSGGPNSYALEGAASAGPGLGKTWGNIAAAGTSGAVMGGVQDGIQGGLYGGALSGLTAGATNYLTGDLMGFKDAESGIINKALSPQVSEQLKKNPYFERYYNKLDFSNLDPGTDLSDPAAFHSALTQALNKPNPNPTSINYQDYSPYWDKAYDLAQSGSPGYVRQFDKLQGTGYGMFGVDDRSDAVNLENNYMLAAQPAYAQMLAELEERKKSGVYGGGNMVGGGGIYGAQGAGGLGSMV